MSTATKIYHAHKIITMNPARPTASHVAVRDGRILGAGTLAELTGWGSYELDERFSDKVLMPGLVEGHSHLMAGSLWRHRYCGYFDVADHNGKIWPGSQSLNAVIDALISFNSSELSGSISDVSSVVGWGFDPIYFGTARCNRSDLDRVSTSQAVGVLHASAHILNVNTEALKQAGYWREGIDHPGIPLGTDGLPTGELKGPDAMGHVLEIVGLSRSFLSGDEIGIGAFGKLCVRAGVTTATDLAAGLSDADVAMLLKLTSDDDYPVRLVPLLRSIGMAPPAAIERALAVRTQSTDRLRLGAIKVVADGSIQGYSARIRWPGYVNGAPNGLWYTAPQTIQAIFDLALRSGIQVHTHTNGDEATEMVLDCFSQAIKDNADQDHRFTLQHCQLADAAQYRRMKALGLCVNLFANHHFYWGDEHYTVTVGPERAERMNACRTALESGVPLAIHSDAPITPLAPLFTAWCAMFRKTASGRTLGEHERIELHEALYAITLGAAYTLKLDGEIGSIETGKRADFCVLNEDPFSIDAFKLKDISVWGTVQGGRVFAA